MGKKIKIILNSIVIKKTYKMKQQQVYQKVKLIIELFQVWLFYKYILICVLNYTLKIQKGI